MAVTLKNKDAEYTVANKTANTFELAGIDGTAFTAYDSGGEIALNPNVDAKANIFRDNAAESVAIKNRLGSTRVFTLITMG